MSLLAALVVSSLLLALIAIPGCLLYRVLLPDADEADWALNGGLTGLGGGIVVLFLCAYVHMVLFLVVWPLLAALAVCVYIKRRLPKPDRRRIPWALIVLLGFVCITRFAVLANSPLPLGFDPSFNLLLVQKAMDLKTVFYDWQPFANADLNYPLGSHYVVAGVSLITRLPAHHVFSAMLIIFSVVMTLQVYDLSRTILKPKAALIAAYVYSFLAIFGSIDYVGWGGLPNLIGMCFLLFGLRSLAAPRKLGRLQTALPALAFTTIAFVHHHVMLTAGAVFGVLFIYYLWRDRPRALAIVLAGGLTAVVGGVYLIPYALRITTLPDTQVLRFEEPLFTPTLLGSSLGWAFALLVLIGLVRHIVCRVKKRERGGGWPAIGIATTTLIGLFIALAYGCRWYSQWRHGTPYVAFTPSRFLSDATPLLAIYAAAAVSIVVERWRYAAIAVVLLAFTNYPRWLELFRQVVPADRIEAYWYIRDNCPEDAIVLAKHHWTAYCTQRRSPYTPLPITENYHGKHEAVKEVLARVVNPGAPLSRDYTVVVIADPGKIPHPSFDIIWTGPTGIRVAQRQLLKTPRQPARKANH